MNRWGIAVFDIFPSISIRFIDFVECEVMYQERTGVMQEMEMRFIEIMARFMRGE